MSIDIESDELLDAIYLFIDNVFEIWNIFQNISLFRFCFRLGFYYLFLLFEFLFASSYFDTIVT